MKTVAYQTFGDLNVLEIVEEPEPSLTTGKVLVRVKAVSINPIDWKIRKGEMKLMSGAKFPRHTGLDFAGVVERTGAAAGRVAAGDQVFGVVPNLMKDGALSEYVVVPATSLWKKPAHLSFAQAASLPVVGTAAVTALRKMGTIGPGTKILVNGATGGLGMILLQLLKRRGAEVTAVTGPKNLEYAEEWGADKVVDYSETNVVDQRETYDVIVDLSDKLPYTQAKPIMKDEARFLDLTPGPIDIALSPVKNLLRGKKHVAVLADQSESKMSELLDAVDSGLQIMVNRVFPFDRSVEAYRYAEGGGVAGKVAIEFS